MRNLVLGESRAQAALAIAGFSVRGIYAGELMAERLGDVNVTVGEMCGGRWLDFADAVAAVDDGGVEFFQVLATEEAEPPPFSKLGIAYLAVGRGETQEAAEAVLAVNYKMLRQVVSTSLDLLDIAPIDEEEELKRWVGYLQLEQVMEIQRRQEPLYLKQGKLELPPLPVGFQPEAQAAVPRNAKAVDWIYPWMTSPDSWHRLCRRLLQERTAAALVVHVKPVYTVDRDCIEQAHTTLEEIEAQLTEQPEKSVVIGSQVESLHAAALARLDALRAQAICARVFLTGRINPCPTLVATVISSLHDPDDGMPFNGAADVQQREPAAVLAALPTTELRYLFGVTEVTAFLRTPVPGQWEIPGLALLRDRTIPMLGGIGDDVKIGTNRHLGHVQEVRLNERFYHSYVIGQTGTGKSTLLQNMILSDIGMGRGVWVLDPHGTLIDKVMARMPDERMDDCVLVDLLDAEHPMPLNLLRIDQLDSNLYCRDRDNILDDLLAHLDTIYNMELAGGPMFETYFRNMFRVMMGTSKPTFDPYPSFSLLKRLFNDEQFLISLSGVRAGNDHDLKDGVRMMRKSRGEATLENIAPYIVSKFERFVSNAELRNMTCQSGCLDIPALVNAGKIVLVNLGRGSFGETASGLLSSMIVSRLRMAVMQRNANDESIKPCYLYVDEFQTVANPRFADMLSECRKYKLAMTLAHQYVGQLPSNVLGGVLGNVGTMMALRVGAEDVETLERALQPGISQQDLLNQQNFRAIVRRISARSETPFTVELDAPQSEAVEQKVAAIRKQSRERYARPRLEVEAEIRRQYEE